MTHGRSTEIVEVEAEEEAQEEAEGSAGCITRVKNEGVAAQTGTSHACERMARCCVPLLIRSDPIL